MRSRVLVLPLLLVAATAGARDIPYLAGRVNDTAGMLSQEERDRIENKLADLEKATGAQVAVLTIDALGDEVLEDYALKVAQTWKLGRKGVDDGALLLIARDDRKMRLEVGYGLESKLTDALSRRILDNVLRPRFKAGDFGGGIEAGVDAIVGTLEGKDVVPAEAPGSGSGQPPPLPVRLLGMLIFTVVVGVFSLLAVFGKGCQSWFLYAFLIPFYGAFPTALLGYPAGLVFFLGWILGFPLLKLWLGKTAGGKAFLASHAALASFATPSGRSSGSGWSGSSWSSGSSSGGFSGGGGSFGGGGSSSSW